jgi:hypothetical protein
MYITRNRREKTITCRVRRGGRESLVACVGNEDIDLGKDVMLYVMPYSFEMSFAEARKFATALLEMIDEETKPCRQKSSKRKP